jgi:2-keto-myo-inositol isomerase
VRLALSGASLPDLPLEEGLEIAAAAGFDAVELWLPSVWPALERLGPDGLASRLVRQRLAVVALAPIADVTFRDRAGREAVAAEVHGAAALARAVGGAQVVVQPGARPDGAAPRDAIGEAQEILARLAGIAERYDVGLLLMPLGYPWASVRTIPDAARIVEAVGRRGLGLALDTFHLHLMRARPEALRPCRPRWIGLVRLADAPEGEIEGLRDHHRLPPGQGVAPIRELVGALRLLGADPAAVVDAPAPRHRGDATGWARGLRERALEILRAPDLASR